MIVLNETIKVFNRFCVSDCYAATKTVLKPAFKEYARVRKLSTHSELSHEGKARTARKLGLYVRKWSKYKPDYVLEHRGVKYTIKECEETENFYKLELEEFTSPFTLATTW